MFIEVQYKERLSLPEAIQNALNTLRTSFIVKYIPLKRICRVLTIVNHHSWIYLKYAN